MPANVMRSGGLCRLAAAALSVLFATLATATPAASQQAGTGASPQRAVLYDEDPTDPKGKQFQGSVTWQIVPADPSGGHEADVAIRGEVTIPERGLKATLVFKRNTDPTLPASHTVDLTFVVPPDFVGSGINTVPGLLMKVKESARGTPLGGLAVKVTDGSFLVGLSNVDQDRSRNIQLLREREWFDIPMVYANGRRGILAIAKGTSGEQAFESALAAWGQSSSIDPPPATIGPRQRAVLYDEDITDPKGKQFTGSVTWEIVPADRSSGHQADIAIRGEVTIPDPGLKVTLVIKRNTDPALPASHTVELTFVDFSGRTVQNIPGLLMKVSPTATGTPLAGLAVKVSDGSFLVGLSNVDKERAHNIQLLRERDWLDIPIVYDNQRRSILAIEKGSTGQRVLDDALAAWGNLEGSLPDAGLK